MTFATSYVFVAASMHFADGKWVNDAAAVSSNFFVIVGGTTLLALSDALGALDQVDLDSIQSNAPSRLQSMNQSQQVHCL